MLAVQPLQSVPPIPMRDLYRDAVLPYAPHTPIETSTLYRGFVVAIASEYIREVIGRGDRVCIGGRRLLPGQGGKTLTTFAPSPRKSPTHDGSGHVPSTTTRSRCRPTNPVLDGQPTRTVPTCPKGETLSPLGGFETGSERFPARTTDKNGHVGWAWEQPVQTIVVTRSKRDRVPLGRAARYDAGGGITLRDACIPSRPAYPAGTPHPARSGGCGSPGLRLPGGRTIGPLGGRVSPCGGNCDE